MKYKINLTIEHPNRKEQSQKTLYSYFSHNDDDYGNGWYLSIIGRGNCSIDWCIDLRYKSFNPCKAIEFLESLCRDYWTGKDGAWRIVDLSITKI